MPMNPPDTPSDPYRPDSEPAKPEARHLRWMLFSAPIETAPSTQFEGRTIHINQYIIAVERWAITLRRHEVGLANEASLSASVTYLCWAIGNAAVSRIVSTDCAGPSPGSVLM